MSVGRIEGSALPVRRQRVRKIVQQRPAGGRRGGVPVLALVIGGAAERTGQLEVRRQPGSARHTRWGQAGSGARGQQPLSTPPRGGDRAEARQVESAGARQAPTRRGESPGARQASTGRIANPGLDVSRADLLRAGVSRADVLRADMRRLEAVRSESRGVAAWSQFGRPAVRRARPGAEVARRATGGGSGQYAPVRLTRRGKVVAQLVLIAAALIVAAGVVAGARAAGDSAEPQGPRPTVVVHEGDTLWNIAERHAPGVDRRAVIDEIRRLNDLDDATVEIGQQLVLPRR